MAKRARKKKARKKSAANHGKRPNSWPTGHTAAAAGHGVGHARRPKHDTEAGYGQDRTAMGGQDRRVSEPTGEL